MLNHTFRYLGRTVMVRDGKAEEAFKVLNKVLGSEGLFNIYRRTRTYEKPFLTRRRVSYEKCRAIYSEDMDRKIKFVMRKNRLEAHPGY